MKQGYRVFGTAIIIGGLLLASVPLVKWGVSSYHQRQALAAWEENQQPALEEPGPMPIEEETEPEPLVLAKEDGLLEIPKINLRAVVLHGIDEDTLKLGPGFYPHSTHPEMGNVSIAAHRGVYGSWFRHVDKLQPGDEIKLYIGGKIHLYEVREQFITHSRDWSIVESDEESPELTLSTCLFTTTTKRLIVKADLVESLYMVVEEVQ
jgi:sortase A